MTNLDSTHQVESLARWRASWQRLACVVAVLAAWCLCPTRADAHCGNYVVVINPSAEYLRNKPIEAPMQTSPTCPCHGPQCRASDSAPAMPVPAQLTPDYGLMLLAHLQITAGELFEHVLPDDWSIQSEAHLLSPDPPPRSRA